MLDDDTTPPDEEFFRGLKGANDRTVSRDDLARMIVDTVGMSSWRQAAFPADRGGKIRVIRDNKAFWHDDLFEGKRVRLKGFHLTSWMPASPGRYHTAEAAEVRRSAKRHLHATRGEFLPLGKAYMVLGGVGSVRLSAKVIDGRQVHLIGASSTGITHEGVPLAVPRT